MRFGRLGARRPSQARPDPCLGVQEPALGCESLLWGEELALGCKSLPWGARACPAHKSLSRQCGSGSSGDAEIPCRQRAKPGGQKPEPPRPALGATSWGCGNLAKPRELLKNDTRVLKSCGRHQVSLCPPTDLRARGKKRRRVGRGNPRFQRLAVLFFTCFGLTDGRKRTVVCSARSL
jgi:hypothetical protein